MDKVITIERHILQQQQLYPGATGTLTSILYDIALAGKMIARRFLVACIVCGVLLLSLPLSMGYMAASDNFLPFLIIW